MKQVMSLQAGVLKSFVVASILFGQALVLQAVIFCQSGGFGEYPRAEEEFVNLRIPFTTCFIDNSKFGGWNDWRQPFSGLDYYGWGFDLDSLYRRHVQLMLRCMPMTGKAFIGKVGPSNLFDWDNMTVANNMNYDQFRELWLESYAKPLVKWCYENGIYLVDLGCETYEVRDGVPNSDRTSVYMWYPFDDNTGDLLKTAADVKWRVNDTHRKLMEWKNKYYPKVVIILSMGAGYNNTKIMDMFSKDALGNYTASCDWMGPELRTYYPLSNAAFSVDTFYNLCVPFIENAQSSIWGMGNLESHVSVAATNRYFGTAGYYLNYNTSNPVDTIYLDYSNYRLKDYIVPGDTPFMEAMEYWLTKPYFMFHNETDNFVSRKYGETCGCIAWQDPSGYSKYAPNTVLDSPEPLGTIPFAWNMDLDGNGDYFNKNANWKIGMDYYYRPLYNRWGYLGHDPESDPYKSRYWYYKKMMFDPSYNYNADPGIQAKYHRPGKPANFADRWGRAPWPLLVRQKDITYRNRTAASPYNWQRGRLFITLRNVCADRPISAPIRIYVRERNSPPWDITGSGFKKATPANIATVLANASGLVKTIAASDYSVPGNGNMTSTNNVVTLSFPLDVPDGQEIYVAIEDTPTVKGWCASSDIPWCGPIEKTALRSQVVEWDLGNSILPAGQVVQVQVRSQAVDSDGNLSHYSTPSLITILPSDDLVCLSCDVLDRDKVAVLFEYSLDGITWMSVQRRDLLSRSPCLVPREYIDLYFGDSGINPFNLWDDQVDQDSNPQSLLYIDDPGFEYDSLSVAGVGRNGSWGLQSSADYLLAERDIGNGLGCDILSVGVFARSPDLAAKLGINWIGYDSQGAQIASGAALWDQPLTGEYEYYAQEFELTDARIDSIRLMFYRSNNAGAILLDDLTVETRTINQSPGFELIIPGVSHKGWSLNDSLITTNGLNGSRAIQSNPSNNAATIAMASQNYIGVDDMGACPFTFEDSPVKISFYAKGTSGSKLGIIWKAYNSADTTNAIARGEPLWNVTVTPDYQRYTVEFRIPSGLPKKVNYLQLFIYRLGSGSLYVDECRLLSMSDRAITSQKGEYIFWSSYWPSGQMTAVPAGGKNLKLYMKAKAADGGRIGAFWQGFDSLGNYIVNGDTGFWNVDPGSTMTWFESAFPVANPRIAKMILYLYHSNVASNPDGKVWVEQLALENVTPRNYLWDGDFELGGVNWFTYGRQPSCIIVDDGVSGSKALKTGLGSEHPEFQYTFACQRYIGRGQSLAGARFKLLTTARSPDGAKLGFYWAAYKKGLKVAAGAPGMGMWNLPLVSNYTTFSGGEFAFPEMAYDEIILYVYRCNYTTLPTSTIFIDNVKLIRIE